MIQINKLINSSELREDYYERRSLTQNITFWLQLYSIKIKKNMQRQIFVNCLFHITKQVFQVRIIFFMSINIHNHSPIIFTFFRFLDCS